MGTFRLEISGLLGDIISNFQSLIQDLQAQGIDPTPFKSGTVKLYFSEQLTAAQNTAITTALNNWRTTIAGTSIIITAEFATPD